MTISPEAFRKIVHAVTVNAIEVMLSGRMERPHQVFIDRHGRCAIRLALFADETYPGSPEGWFYFYDLAGAGTTILKPFLSGGEQLLKLLMRPGTLERLVGRSNAVQPELMRFVPCRVVERAQDAQDRTHKETNE